MTDQVADDIYF